MLAIINILLFRILRSQSLNDRGNLNDSLSGLTSHFADEGIEVERGNDLLEVTEQLSTRSKDPGIHSFISLTSIY